ncbi:MULTISPECIES: hypothetical protein [unclassified Leptolyngbya]|uniref:hypothetical protein n=1 Tax=unclassified Leptolyngbya TaxID=2650499 RepID=UPI0016895B9F|nr:MULTISPECIES: hypothetical protein [unclassified Leptolyngbya]MBD1911615.1 hypothetical protein [Leptolyngbya sp. FACHB-8]MBD2155212.1 hypothetical protein [Leptolyngbya sp. FACHB-16]
MELLLLLAALVIAFLVFTWLVRVVKATLSLVVAIALLIILLRVFGVSPGEIWETLTNLWSRIFGS